MNRIKKSVRSTALIAAILLGGIGQTAVAKEGAHVLSGPLSKAETDALMATEHVSATTTTILAPEGTVTKSVAAVEVPAVEVPGAAEVQLRVAAPLATTVQVTPPPATTVQVTPTPTTTVQVAPVTSVMTKDVVHTPLHNGVVPRLEVSPMAGTPVDVMKRQLHNRISAGMLSGRITDREADDLNIALQALVVQEAQFKLSGNGLTESETANLQRKFNLLNLAVQDAESNSNFNDFIASAEARQRAIQRRINYNLAAGNMTFAEAEQMHTLLSHAADQHANYRATGNMVTGDEMETMHKDLHRIEYKINDRINGEIIVTLPDVRLRRMELMALIQTGLKEGKLTIAEKELLSRDYQRILVLEQQLLATTHPDAEELRALAKQIDNLNFILKQEYEDRAIAGQASKQMF